MELFNMLHGSKKDVATKVGATIKSLKESGELAKLAKKHEDGFIKSGLAP
jgi:hypothetical protein